MEAIKKNRTEIFEMILNKYLTIKISGKVSRKKDK